MSGGRRPCADRWPGCDDWEVRQLRSLRAHYHLLPRDEVMERHLDLLTEEMVDLGGRTGGGVPRASRASRHLPRLSLVLAAATVVAGLALLVSVPIDRGTASDQSAAPAAGPERWEAHGRGPDHPDGDGGPDDHHHDGDGEDLSVPGHDGDGPDEDRPGDDPARTGVGTAVVATPLTCGGLPATIIGTDGPDRLSGTAGADVIVALDGDDQVFGLEGDDVICGGAGDDIISGGAGDDRIGGEEGTDTLIGGTGDDLLDGQVGLDTLIPGVR